MGGKTGFNGGVLIPFLPPPPTSTNDIVRARSWVLDTSWVENQAATPAGRGRRSALRAILLGLGAAVVFWLLVVAVLLAAGRKSMARDLAELIPNLLHL